MIPLQWASTLMIYEINETRRFCSGVGIRGHFLYFIYSAYELYEFLFSVISFSGDVTGKTLDAWCILGKRDLAILAFQVKLIESVGPLLYKGFDGFKDLLDQAHFMLRLNLSNRWQTNITQSFVLKQSPPPLLYRIMNPKVYFICIAPNTIVD